MCLYNITITDKSYTADVDGKTYTIDITGFPKETAVAMAIEAIRAQVLGAAAAPVVAKKPKPAKPFDTTAKPNA